MSVRHLFAGSLFALALTLIVVHGQPHTIPTATSGASLAGSVVDDQLAPLAEARVTLVRRAGTSYKSTTDERGEFAFTGVPLGEYTMTVNKAGYAPVQRTFAVASMGTVRLGLAARPEGTVPLAEIPAMFESTESQAVSGSSSAGSNPPPPSVSNLVFSNRPGSIYGVVADSSGGIIPGATVSLRGVGTAVSRSAVSSGNGAYEFHNLHVGEYDVTFSLTGFKTHVRSGVKVTAEKGTRVDGTLEVGQLSETVSVTAAAPLISTRQTTSHSSASSMSRQDAFSQVETASYKRVVPHRFVATASDPLSTFGADVDTASYSNVRRFLNQGQLPPTDAVRVEEFLNYFRFDYASPERHAPVAITSEVGECPWAPDHKLVLIGARARDASNEEKGRNLVFLLDVSGSMASEERLPLLKTSLRMFVDTLRPADEVSIVTYSGTSGLWLPPTSARRRDRIHAAINALQAGGSTNGASGIRLAYRVAREQFIPGGVNRVVLATDGDFNVGVTDNDDLLTLIERQKQSGVFLTVLGVGTHNLQDDRMEMLADRGNGQYAYLDSLQEARRVLVRAGDSTMETVAQDVKFQVEFNPAMVRAWRQIGYENRALAHEDFKNDQKDGGELGAGHMVTMLYEVVPVGARLPRELRESRRPSIDPLIYQTTREVSPASGRNEWLTVRVRYKDPGASESRAFLTPVATRAASQHLPFAAVVAEFGLLMRDTDASSRQWTNLLGRVRALDHQKAEGDRAEFAQVVELAASLKKLRPVR